MKPKQNLIGLSLVELEKFFISMDEKKFRAHQVFNWIHSKGVIDFSKMTNLSKNLVYKLEENSYIKTPKVVNTIKSNDGTVKYLLKLDEEAFIEMVTIPEKKRITLCVSSQAGCALQCSFCATGYHGFKRNLDSSEIISQLWIANFSNPEGRLISNVVFMGMGEPLLNTDNVLNSISVMQDQKGYALSRKRITLSTSGVVPALKTIAKKTNVALAISLHAPSDDLRDELVPINQKYPIESLINAAKYYLSKQNKKDTVTIEYILIKNKNDSLIHAKKLAKILSELKCKINLIPFNSFTGSNLEQSSQKSIDDFKNFLISKSFITTVRRTRGDEVDGACGQLVGALLNPKKGKRRHKNSINLQTI